MKYCKKFFCIFVLVLLIFLVFSYFLPILSYQEARRVVITKETWYGNFFIPTYNGEPYFTKPPLYTWISIPFFALGNLFSSEIFFLRLISFLSYLLTAFILYELQKRDPLKTILSFLILFSSFRFLSFVYRIDLEPLFVFFTITSFYFLIQFKNTSQVKYVYLFYLFFSFAFLVRGPLHFFLLLSLLIYAFIFKDKNLLKAIFFPKGWLLFILLSLPWYVFGYLKFGPSVFKEFIDVDISKRIAGKGDPFYYYLKALFLNFIPWIILILIKIRTIIKKVVLLLNDDTKIYLFAFGISILLLSFTGEKFDKYLLFLYPFVALFLTNLLLNLYSFRFLLSFGVILFVLNCLAILAIQFNSLEDLRYKIDIIKANFPKKENKVFYKEENPLFIFYSEKPIPVLKEKRDVWELLKKGYGVFATEKINEFIPALVFQDPYKKGRVWYYYKATFSK